VSVPRRRWPDDPARPGRVNADNFVSGVRFRRSLQEANPQSILLKAAFVSGLSYQLVLLQEDNQFDQRRAQPPKISPGFALLLRKETSPSSCASRPTATSTSTSWSCPSCPALARPRSASSNPRTLASSNPGKSSNHLISHAAHPSFLLSPRGARVLAASRSEDPKAYITISRTGATPSFIMCSSCCRIRLARRRYCRGSSMNFRSSLSVAAASGHQTVRCWRPKDRSE
jgi:hypothetical protein